MSSQPYGRRQRVSERQEPKYDSAKMARLIREYYAIQLELRHPRNRYMPVIADWLRTAIDAEGDKPVKAAARTALQCWKWEGLDYWHGEVQLEAEAETDIALERLFEVAGLEPVIAIDGGPGLEPHDRPAREECSDG